MGSRRGRRSAFARGMRSRAAICALLAVFGLTTLTSMPRVARAEATAAEKETARGLMKKGRAKRDAGDHKGALEAFVAADQIMDVPTTALEVGRSQMDLGLFVEARDSFLRVVRMPHQPKEPTAFAEARKQAESFAHELEERISTLQLVITGASPGAKIEIEIDGVKVASAMTKAPVKVNPGAHVIVVTASGVKRTKEAKLGEGEVKEITIDLTPSKDETPSAPPPVDAPLPPPSSGLGTVAWIGLGVAGVGIVVGSVTGVFALSKTSSVKERCVGTRCPRDTEDDVASARSMATISTISFTIAAIGAGTFVIGLLTKPSPEAAPATTSSSTKLGPLRDVRPLVGVGTFGLVGSF